MASGPALSAGVDLVPLPIKFEFGVLYGLGGWWRWRYWCELGLFAVGVATAVGLNCGDSPRSERGVRVSFFVLCYKAGERACLELRVRG